MMKSIMTLGALMLLLPVQAATLSRQEAWQNISDPLIMGHYFNYELSKLPLQGSVKEKNHYWSSDYWALNKGNINYRWYAPVKTGFNLNSPDYQRARRMSIPELAQLAPSEKYDLFIGRYDYPLKNEVDRVAADSNALNWEGICHGWAPAAMNHPEPLPKLMRNPDGIEIPFGSSDIKALLSYYYANGFEVPDTNQMGRRCFENSRWSNSSDCREDLNAGAFHIVLTNRLGINRMGFIADVNRYAPVSNKPIISYQSLITGKKSPARSSASGTTQVMQVKTVITYVVDKGHDWRPVLKTSKQYLKQETYLYDLDLNARGVIIGGEWRSTIRPDFLWLKNKPRKFEGVFSRLGELL